MRTLKNVFGKMIGLALLSCITFSAFGQSSRNVELLDYRDDKKVKLYVSPFNFINPAGNTFQLTAGKSFWRKSEIQISIAQRLGGGNPYFAYNIRGLGIIGIDAKFERGTRVGLEIQQVYHRAKSVDLYIGLEAAYSHDVIFVDNLIFIIPFSVEERITRKQSILNGKVGFKFFVANNFLVDLYVGLGVKRNTFQDMEATEEVTFENSLTLPCNVKFGYQF